MRHLTTCFLLLALLAGCGTRETEETSEAPATESPTAPAAEAAAPDRVTLTAAEQQVGGVRLGTQPLADRASLWVSCPRGQRTRDGDWPRGWASVRVHTPERPDPEGSRALGRRMTPSGC